MLVLSNVHTHTHTHACTHTHTHTHTHTLPLPYFLTVQSLIVLSEYERRISVRISVRGVYANLVLRGGRIGGNGAWTKRRRERRGGKRLWGSRLLFMLLCRHLRLGLLLAAVEEEPLFPVGRGRCRDNEWSENSEGVSSVVVWL